MSQDLDWYFINDLSEKSKNKKYLRLREKNIQKTLTTNLESCYFRDAGKSLSPTSSTLARLWQVPI